MQLGANEPPRDTRLGVRIPPPPQRTNQVLPWWSWCNGNTVVCDSTIDGFDSLRSH
jgi:hypothetical protein